MHNIKDVLDKLGEDFIEVTAKERVFMNEKQLKEKKRGLGFYRDKQTRKSLKRGGGRTYLGICQNMMVLCRQTFLQNAKSWETSQPSLISVITEITVLNVAISM